MTDTKWTTCCGRAVAALLTVAAIGLAAQAGEPVGGINISLEQIPGGIAIGFGNDDIPAIPADYFGPGSLPFEGIVELDLSSPMRTSRGDYVPLDGLPPSEPAQGTIPIEIVQLDLVSSAPITVTTPTGALQYEFTMTVTSREAVGLSSELHIDHTEPFGGTAYAVDSFFDIDYRLEWRQVEGPFVFTTQTGQLRLGLQQDTPWRHSEPGGSSLDGFFLGTDGTSIVPYAFVSPNDGLVMNLYSAPIPEPATLGLLALTSAWLLLGRWHVQVD